MRLIRSLPKARFRLICPSDPLCLRLTFRHVSSTPRSRGRYVSRPREASSVPSQSSDLVCASVALLGDHSNGHTPLALEFNEGIFDASDKKGATRFVVDIGQVGDTDFAASIVAEDVHVGVGCWQCGPMAEDLPSYRGRSPDSPVNGAPIFLLPEGQIIRAVWHFEMVSARQGESVSGTFGNVVYLDCRSRTNECSACHDEKKKTDGDSAGCPFRNSHLMPFYTRRASKSWPTITGVPHFRAYTFLLPFVSV